MPRWLLPSGVLLALALGVLAFLGLRNLRSRTAPKPRPESRRTLAMVSLDNLSPSPEAAWFAEAMSDELLAELVQLRSVSVVARLPRASADAGESARQFGAELLLQGSARLEENRFRLRLRLLEVVTGQEAWSGDLDRPLDRILEALAWMVSGLGPAAVPATPQPEAYYQYLLGRALLARAAYEDSAGALAKAVELDPNYAAAHALLAQARAHHYRSLRPDPATLDLAAAASDQALRLAPDRPESLLALAVVRGCQGNWNEALDSASQALEKRPNDPWIQVALSWIHTWRRPADPDRVRGHAEEALRLAPELGLAYVQLARGLILASRHTEADAALQRAAALLPDSFLAHLAGVEYYLSLQQYAQARSELDTILALTPESPLARFYLACLQAAEDPTEEAQTACQAAQEEDPSPFCACSR
jgi:TolB-like protein/cytochrome c-type biogenesis protein CcmH/NrfG